MFTGRRDTRRVDLSGHRNLPVNRNDILESARIMRIQRERNRQIEASSLLIQATYRSHRSRRSVKRALRAEFDSKYKMDSADANAIRRCLTAFLLFYDRSLDSVRLREMAEILIASIRQTDIDKNYVQLLLSSELTGQWISQMQRTLKTVFDALLEQFIPALVSVIFLVFNPEYWPFRPPNADIASASVIQFVLNHNASVAMRSAFLLKFPWDPPEADLRSEKINLGLLLVKSCLKLLCSSAVDFFVRDILTIPCLLNRKGIQGMQSLYAKQTLSLIYRSICENNGAVLSEITTKYGNVGDPSYPSIGWLMGNLLQLSLPSLEHDVEDVQLFSALSAIIRIDSSVLFPLTVQTRLGDAMGDEDAILLFELDSLYFRLKQQLSFFVDRRILNCIVRAARHEKEFSEAFLSSTNVLYEILRSWKNDEILSMVTFGTDLVQSLWSILSGIHFETFSLSDYERVSPALSVFCLTYGHYLKVIDDEEFHAQNFPFDITQTVNIILTLRTVLIHLFWTVGISVLALPWACYLRDVAATIFQQLRDRQSRKPFTDKSIFVMTDQGNQEFQREFSKIVVDALTSVEVGNRSMLILKRIPVIIPFHQRVKMFYRIVDEDRNREIGSMHRVRIRRNYFLHDAFTEFMALGDDVANRIKVHFVDEFGQLEAGIDGGGLFKEFMNNVCMQALNPQTGMFKETIEREHYPSPSSGICREDHLMFFKFFGIIIGKILSHGIQIEPRFANFFLRKLTSSPTCIDDLRSLDPEISKNVLFLKSYDGDFEDLGLFFCVINDEVGQKQVVELCPGGSSVAVTKLNRLAFMHQLADYKLNQQIRQQTNAFISGLQLIISRTWFQMFSPDEIQMLISGSKHAIDVEDMKANMKYTGFQENDVLIDWFWEILRSMSPEDVSLTLRFFTSCSRAPLLGFSVLYPGLCLQKSQNADPSALPSSSTCVNLMKLPPYTSKAQMQEKLLYAIRSHVGFYLA